MSKKIKNFMKEVLSMATLIVLVKLVAAIIIVILAGISQFFNNILNRSKVE